MLPFAFMRLRKAKDLAFPPGRLSENSVVVQQKYDGFKALVSKSDRGLCVYTRRGVDITGRLPTVLLNKLSRLLAPGSTILGELIFLDKGKQSLTKVQSIVGSKDAVAQQKLKRMAGRMQYVAYDVMEYRGVDLRPDVLRDRVVHLKAFPSRGVVHRAKDYAWKDRQVAVKDSLKGGGEGVVIKELSAAYNWKAKGMSEPFGSSWKFKAPGKKANVADVILESYRKGKEKLIFSAYQMHNGKRVEVGGLSGLDRKTEAGVKKLIDGGKRVVAEVSYQQRQPSGRFRHMGWMRLRPDKPLKSATVRENPMDQPMLWFVVVETPRSAKIDSSHQWPGVAFGRQLELEEDGKRVLVFSESGLANYRKLTGRRVPAARRGPTKNPRPSKVKNALAAEAIRYREFDVFATRYWNSCARGIYWIPVDHHNYLIGEREKKQITAGKFFVYCNPIVAESADKDVRYMAELNVNRLDPGSLHYTKGEDGTKISVKGQPDMIVVQRVIPVDKALRAFKYQLSLLPSSKEELLAFWDMSWEKHEDRQKKAAEKAGRVKEREARKKEREAKKAAREAAKAAGKKRSKKKSTKKKSTKKKSKKKAAMRVADRREKRVGKRRAEKAGKKRSVRAA